MDTKKTPYILNWLLFWRYLLIQRSKDERDVGQSRAAMRPPGMTSPGSAFWLRAATLLAQNRPGFSDRHQQTLAHPRRNHRSRALPWVNSSLRRAAWFQVVSFFLPVSHSSDRWQKLSLFFALKLPATLAAFPLFPFRVLPVSPVQYVPLALKCFFGCFFYVYD